MSDTIPDAIAARAEAARIAEHQAALESLRQFGEPLAAPDPVIVIDMRIQAMVEVFDREWEEFDVEASVAFAASSARLWDAREAMVRRLEGDVPAAEAPNDSVHLAHCNRDEWVGTCKYGEDLECPALGVQLTQSEKEKMIEALMAPHEPSARAKAAAKFARIMFWPPESTP